MEIVTGIFHYIHNHASEILGIWVLLEQLTAANPKMKSNSTFQLISNGVKALLGKSALKK